MTTQDGSVGRDELSDDSVSMSPEDDRAALAERRLARSLALQDAALSKEDPLEALVEVQAAGMWEIAARLEEMIRNKLETTNVQVDDIDQVSRPLDSYLRLQRQAERYANLTLRIAEQRGEPRREKRAGQTSPAADFWMDDPLRRVGDLPPLPR